MEVDGDDVMGVQEGGSSGVAQLLATVLCCAMEQYVRRVARGDVDDDGTVGCDACVTESDVVREQRPRHAQLGVGGRRFVCVEGGGRG